MLKTLEAMLSGSVQWDFLAVVCKSLLSLWRLHKLWLFEQPGDFADFSICKHPCSQRFGMNKRQLFLNIWRYPGFKAVSHFRYITQNCHHTGMQFPKQKKGTCLEHTQAISNITESSIPKSLCPMDVLQPAAAVALCRLPLLLLGMRLASVHWGMKR